MSNIFFTSDHHFDHKNILQYCNRPFTTVDEMNEALIERYNSLVKPEDLVYFLGDFALTGKNEMQAYAKRLNGHKHLYMGNHDRFSKTAFMNAGFEVVVNGKGSIEIAGHQVDLCHYPYAWDDAKEAFLLHGHSHSPQMQAIRVFGKVLTIDVGVDAWEYYPISIERIENIIQDFGMVPDSGFWYDGSRLHRKDTRDDNRGSTRHSQ